MADRPILFSAPMVRALLEGRKTQTRRIIKPQPTGRIDPLISYNHGRMEIAFGPDMRDKDGGPKWWRPLAQAGDRLWVREAWRCHSWASDVATFMYRAHEKHSYTEMTEQFPVAGREYVQPGMSWKPSIHMPRWASRITLEATAIKVERLQDCSEVDAYAEGCVPDDSGLNPNHIGPARQIFRSLWDDINGPGAWDKNPWVVAYTFNVINRNIDLVEVAA
ncbi:hypothetical protein [Ochrobactrum soli]|uniref:Phage-related protein n=1 Tax=Ochrobactrum soli TaxID=2448455 RepID=A0A2P9HHM1_9HYPH|nr:hypothetical protein [[Ochrobactrum] soli]SPL63611.1 Phage-related protein [[Ochrobactrum] soli]